MVVLEAGPGAVELEGFVEEAGAAPSLGLAAAEEEAWACVEAEATGDVLFGAAPDGTVSNEQSVSWLSTRGTSTVFEEDGPAATSQDSPLTRVLLSVSLSDGW